MLFPFFMNVVRIPARFVLGFFVLIQNLLPFLTAGAWGGGVAHGAHLGGFFVGLLAAWLVNRRRRFAGSAPVEAADRDAAPPPPGSLAALIEDGDYEVAARRYVRLSSAETRGLLSERHSLMLGTWMAARGHPHAALALFQQHVRDYPMSSTAAEAHLAAGLLQLRTFSEPAAASRHLLEVLALDPRSRDGGRGPPRAGRDCGPGEVPVEPPPAGAGAGGVRRAASGGWRASRLTGWFGEKRV